MRHTLFILLITSSLLTLGAQDTTLSSNKIIENGKEYYLYEVQESDGFMAIGRKYGIAYQDIIEANKDAAFGGLHVGEIIRIPIKKVSVKSNKYIYHKVETGETLFFISRKYGVSIHDIVVNNPGAESVLKIGMELKIPKETQAASLSKTFNTSTDSLSIAPKADNYIYHTVQPSETAYGITRKYNIGLEEFAKANPGLETSALAIGVKVRIPKKKEVVQKQYTSEEMRDTRFIYHRIKNGETLTTVASLYQVPENVILTTNHLDGKLPPVGYMLKIPHSYKYQVEVEETNQLKHIIQRKDDIRDIAEKYQTPIMDIKAANPQIKKWHKLKRGKTLTIPTLTVSSVDTLIQRNAADTTKVDLIHYFEQQDASLGDTLHISFLWPLFLEKNDTLNLVEVEDSLTGQIVKVESGNKRIYPDQSNGLFREYFFGALMAINDLKERGVIMKVHYYDIKFSGVNALRILQESSLLESDIIFGPAYPNQMKPVADYCLKNRIRMVIPFYSGSEEINDNPFIYQVIPSSGVELPQIAQNVANDYSKANIILVKGKKHNERETLFTDFLKSELYKPDSLLYRDINYKEINFNRDNMGGLTALMSKEKENLVIIPAKKSEVTSQVIPVLEHYQKRHKDIEIKLLGFSEWQKFDGKELENIFNVECELYSPLYCAANDSSPQKQNFKANYKTYFGGDPTISYQYYGMLGYDVCSYFITGLAQYGNRLENHLDELEYKGLCTKFDFERVNNWGGFVNTNLYQLEYKNTFDIELVE